MKGILLTALAAISSLSLIFASEVPLTANITTNIVISETSNFGKLPEFVNDKETNVQFQFFNNENTSIHIAGYFGSFYYHKKGKIDDTPYANLTTSKIGPLAIEPGQNSTFDAKIMVNLPPDDFNLIISFFVGYQGEMIVIEADPIKVTISDPPVSFFDPKFLFVQLVLGLSVIGIGYALSNSYLIPYFESKKSDSSLKKQIVEKKSVNPGTKGYDESWIPSQHLASTSQSLQTKSKIKKSS